MAQAEDSHLQVSSFDTETPLASPFCEIALPHEILLRIEAVISIYFINPKKKTRVYYKRANGLQITNVFEISPQNLPDGSSTALTESIREDGGVVLLNIQDFTYPLEKSSKVQSPSPGLYVFPINENVFYGIYVDSNSENLKKLETVISENASFTKSFRLDKKMEGAAKSIEHQSKSLTGLLSRGVTSAENLIHRGKEKYKESSPYQVLENSSTAKKAVKSITGTLTSIKTTVVNPIAKDTKSLVDAGTQIPKAIIGGGMECCQDGIDKEASNIIIQDSKTIKEGAEEMYEDTKNNWIVQEALETRKTKKELKEQERKANGEELYDESFSVKAHWKAFKNLATTVQKSATTITTGASEASEILQDSVSDASLECIEYTWGEEGQQLALASASLGVSLYEVVEDLQSLTLQIRPTPDALVEAVIMRLPELFDSDDDGIKEETFKQGPLMKRMELTTLHWKYRYGILTNKNLLLYKSEPGTAEDDSSEGTSLKKIVKIVTSKDKIFYLQAQSLQDRDEWMQIIMQKSTERKSASKK